MPGLVLLFIAPYLINMLVFTLPGLKADLISGIIILFIASGISFIGDKPPIRIISVLVVLTGYILVSRVTVELNEENSKALNKAHFVSRGLFCTSSRKRKDSLYNLSMLTAQPFLLLKR